MPGLQERERTQSSGETFEKRTQNAPTTAAFHAPIHGRVGQEPVRILAVGDLPGQSPAYLCVDDSGYSTWLSMREVRILDPNFLPIGKEQLSSLLR